MRGRSRHAARRLLIVVAALILPSCAGRGTPTPETSPPTDLERRGKGLTRSEVPESSPATREWIWAPYLYRDPATPQERAQPDISTPGPDTANFPNSAFTLPEGRFYFENSPVGYYSATQRTAPQYDWELFLRYGVTDNLEFRLFTNGLTVVEGAPTTVGFSPLTFDVKYQIWEENLAYRIPAVALETYVQTTWGSSSLSNHTQWAWSVNLDHTLPFGLGLEWNIGLTSIFLNHESNLVEETLSWSLQRDLTEDVALFVHGYHNGAALPRGSTVRVDRERLFRSFNGQVFGAGATWTLDDTLEVFGSANAGIGDAPGFIGLAGFAVAF